MADDVKTGADAYAASVTPRELSEGELSAAAGGAGKITFNRIVIIKVDDKSSPQLFL